MKRTVLLLTIVSIGLGLARTADADSPPVIPIQGVLMDKNKVPIDASVEIRFSLHDNESAGNELWFETQTVPVNNGLDRSHQRQVRRECGTGGVRCNGLDEVVSLRYPVAEIILAIPGKSV